MPQRGGLTFAEAAKGIGRLGAVIDGARWDIVSETAKIVEEEMLAGPPRVGVGRNSLLAGGRWGVQTQLLTRARMPQARVRYRGPLHWIEYGTARHLIVARNLVGGSRAKARRLSDELGARYAFAGSAAGVFGQLQDTYRRGRRKGQRRRGSRALSIGENWRPVAFHPGTSPRPFWDGVKRRAKSRVARRGRSFHADAIRRAGLGGY